MDHDGYVMTGTSFLLILPVIILLMVLIDVNFADTESKSMLLESENALHIFQDLESNIPRIGRQVLKEEAYTVLDSKKPLYDSKKVTRDNMQLKIDQITGDYNKNGLQVTCTIQSVKESEDPFEVEVTSVVVVKKEKVSHQQILHQKISLNDPNDPIPDPMPFVKCEEYGGVSVNGSRILYGHSLASYLQVRGEKNWAVYENATSPLFINQCPYDPFKGHGTPVTLETLKNCLDNGFYHESNDGACFLCRLEGKSTCYHQGLEIFIVPTPTRNQSYNAPCSVDHVVFGDNSSEIYPGGSIQYFKDGDLIFLLFLDDSHRKKYGLPPI
ncbi:MAG: hypothetical protein ABFC91_02765 [Methanobacteriaceae archaeon]